MEFPVDLLFIITPKTNYLNAKMLPKILQLTCAKEIYYQDEFTKILIEKCVEHLTYISQNQFPQ